MHEKLILFTLLFWFVISNSQEAPHNSTNNNETTQEINSIPKNKEPSILSQIAGWIYPFGGSDNKLAESRDSPYFPQQQHNPQHKSNCNPCNEVPWVPITTNYGHNTIVGFVQPQVLKNDHLYGQSISQIRPPSPDGGYGQNFDTSQLQHQPVLNNDYGHPNHHQNVNRYPPMRSKHQYGRQSSGFQGSNKKYHPPKFTQRPYQNRPPIGNYRPPSKLDLPKHSKIPPPRQSEYKTIVPNYVPLPNYSPPENFAPPPNSAEPNYGHFANYAPPPINNLPPANYGPPPNNAPPINYGPPPNNAPPANYGPPPNNAPSANYGPPPNNAPPGNYGPPPNNAPQANYGLPIKNYGLPFNNPPPPPNYEALQNYASQQNYDNPSNFGPSLNYVPHSNQQSPSNFNSHPIPLPNLSPGPVAPLHEPQIFKPEYHELPNYNQGVESVQIVKSLPVADYLASVEYPISVIQSPIFEVNVANATSQAEIPDDLRSLSQNVNNYNNEYQHQKLPENNFKDFKEFRGNNRFTDRPLFEKPGYTSSPIVVEDTHVAASNSNQTYESDLKEDESISGFYDGIHSGFLNQIIDGFNKEEVIETTTKISPPVIEYNNWSPSNGLSGTMGPPPVGESVWLKSFARNEDVTKKPKQIQIIIPYTTNTKDVKVSDKIRTTLPLYTEPPYKESVWMEHTRTSFEPQKIKPTTSKPTTEVINIRDLLKDNNYGNVNKLPFDIIRFQKNIDVWTEQEFSNKMLQHLNTENSFVNKNIPDDYFTTPGIEETTKTYMGDYESAGSHKKLVTIKDIIESNSIINDGPTSTTAGFHRNGNKTHRPSWSKIQVAVSPLTKEKIYVVTPLPTSGDRNKSRVPKENDFSNTQTTFSISIKPMKNVTEEKDVKVVLSEWPHLINNLETTTSTTSKPSTSRHPLLGLMDLSSYAPPTNSTIQTFSGHSKVLNAAPSKLKHHRPKAEE